MRLPSCSHPLPATQLHLTKDGGAARLDGLNFAQVDRLAAEAGRELGDVESNALGREDRAQSVARGAANASVRADGLLEGTVLLSVVTVGAEGGVGGSSIAAAVGSCEALGKLA
jgi:hypothetical protein